MSDSVWPPWSCPTHRKLLILDDELLCCPMGHSFPVVRDIPRFVSGSNYSDHFGAQWNQYRLTQLDSYTGRTITSDRIRRCLGGALWNNLSGKHVLECGCGAGRFTEILLERGAKVTSVDLSNAVEANARNFPVNESHRLLQADILDLPFLELNFDLVLCLGVIQHTPIPEKTIERLYYQVKPGGALIIDHYTYSLGALLSLKPLFRAWLKRMPPAKAMAISESLTDRFIPLHRRLRNKYPLWTLLSRMSPLTTFYRMYPDLPEKLQREWALLDTHDSLTDWFKHRRTRRQIKELLSTLGLEEIRCVYAGNGVEARGVRPESSRNTRFVVQ
jgi:SAM-dependent methyltransferase